jgi:hypothetical protein
VADLAGESRTAEPGATDDLAQALAEDFDNLSPIHGLSYSISTY